MSELVKKVKKLVGHVSQDVECCIFCVHCRYDLNSNDAGEQTCFCARLQDLIGDEDDYDFQLSDWCELFKHVDADKEEM